MPCVTLHCCDSFVSNRWMLIKLQLIPLLSYSAPPLSFCHSTPFSVPMINCGDCEKDGVFHQYAYEATSPHICDTSGYWTPDEAVGQSNSIRFWTSLNENLELSMCYCYISFIIRFNVSLSSFMLL